jgi:hypothetical protein
MKAKNHATSERHYILGGMGREKERERERERERKRSSFY